MFTYRSGTDESVIDYVLLKEEDRKLVWNMMVISSTLKHGLFVNGCRDNGNEKEEVRVRTKEEDMVVKTQR